MISDKMPHDWAKYSQWARRTGYISAFVMVAGVAARVSYSHIRDVALYGHQPSEVAALLPLAVDGMMLIATLAMAEDKAANRHPRGWARSGFWFGAAVSTAANIAATVVQHGWDPLSIGIAALAPILLLWAIEIVARPGRPKTSGDAPRRRFWQRFAATSVVAPVAGISVADLESPDLPAAPVSPAPAGGRPRIPTAVLPGGKVVETETGKPAKPTTARRRRSEVSTSK
jgi:hypothetical protein